MTQIYERGVGRSLTPVVVLLALALGMSVWPAASRAQPSGQQRASLVPVVIAGQSASAGTGLAGETEEQEQPSQADLEQIARATAALRGLPLLSKVETQFLTRDEATARIAADINEELPAAVAAAESQALAAFGLVPANTDLRAAYARYFERGVGGFYDPEANALFVLDDDGRLDSGAVVTYSHELVHALQEQHLGLDALGGDVGERLTDQGLAVAALVEGDATVAGFEYLSAHPEWFERDEPLLEQLLGLGAARGTPEPGATPVSEPILPLLRATFPFPYSYGRDCVAALREAGGWPAVNAAFAAPPLSTEQVMHPEKFLAERDDPTPVSLPDPAATLGPGWQTVTEKSLGEFLTAVVLATDSASSEAAAGFGRGRIPEPIANAAAGWDGDRYALWAGDVEEVLVWRSVWDSERDARAFALALLAREEARWGSQHRGDALDSVAIAAKSGEVRLAVSGQTVYYVFASEPSLAERTIIALREDRRGSATTRDQAPAERSLT